MKILYLIHQFYPMFYTGTEKFVLNMAMQMQKMDHQVKVITYSLEDIRTFEQVLDDILVKEYTFKGIPVTAVRHKNYPNHLHSLLEDNRLFSAAKRLLEKEKPDIIHVGHPMRITEFIIAAKSLNIPYIMTLTDYHLICPKTIMLTNNGKLCSGSKNGEACSSLCMYSNEFINRRRKVALEILENAQKVISPSKFLAEMFKQEVSGLNVDVINHGISNGKVQKNYKVYRNNDTLTFCFAGTFASYKGLHILIDAFNKIHSNRINLKIYGSGIDKQYVNRIRQLAKGNSRIEFCGVYSDNDVSKIFNQVDVVIVPSLWYENYPLVLHEALACNVPVIASDCGGMEEKIKNGANGFTFKVGDANHLTKTLEKIIANPEMLNRIKKKIKNQSIPTVDQEAYKYEREYKKIIEE